MRVLDVRADPEPDLSEAVAHLRTEGILAYPTETVYGLGGACTAPAVEAVRRTKGRFDDKPLLALVPSLDSVGSLAWTDAARELASIFWPGSLTLVLRDPGETFPAGVRSASGTVGVRLSPHPIVKRLLEGFDAPVTSTSLNEPGEPPVSSGGRAREVLGRLDADGVMLLDAGTLPASRPSTVVDCTGPVPVVLREGAVPIHRLRCALPEIHGTRID